ncbi:uncharacterized protein J4E84_005237 [Alternaria hordeiaustralica]|uniref:uncharacterized protein n=1 Tax=Alternaria hordeiaustralica TaxID=1187925 RepID=UPI0020C29685|nr:uncharacterized protein J4E84_005237 [Alternaria hordeiaustralica]KAI4686866.1 hypothetical protein J4E84_005237 [Alternaria hordeiaustralica]
MTTSVSPATHYEAARKKGLLLFQMLEASFGELGNLLKNTDTPTESEYLNYEDLLENNWVERSSGDDSKILARLLEDLGINTSNNIPVSHEHHGVAPIQESLQEGLEMQIRFDSVINTSGGMIAAMNTYSPVHDWRKAKADAENALLKQAGHKSTERNNVGDDVPSLKYWSDVAYLQWACRNTDSSDLRHVMRMSITNEKTKAVIQHIKQQAHPKATGSYSFDVDNRDQVAAFLGTPNGAGVAWLLIQHKQQLGHKTVYKKGKKMLKIMHGGSAVTQSPYFTPGEVGAMGYKRTTRPRSVSGLSKKLDSLGIQGSNSHFINVTNDYTKDVITGETIVSVSEVRFMSEINFEAGILVANYSYSPTYKAKALKSLSTALFPSLKHWSDIAFHQWVHCQLDQEEERDLKFIMRENISNEDTLAIINNILDAPPRQSQAYTRSGLYLDMNSDHAIALLGTAHGAGVAWLLAQHRDQLGRKVIAGIRIFYSDEPPEGDRALNLLFYLRDASASKKPIEKL